MALDTVQTTDRVIHFQSKTSRLRTQTERMVEITPESDSIIRCAYEYSAELVADSVETIREYASDRYLIALNGLSPEAASVLDAAVEEHPQRYEECNTPSAGLSELSERVEDEQTLLSPNDDEWYVEYDGERYLLMITEFQV